MNITSASAIRPATIVFFIALAPLCLHAQFSGHLETPVEQREGYEQKLRRDAWMEQMHGTAPGVNWRVIERENRDAEMSRLAAKERALHTVQSAVDTIAGVVQGRWRERGSGNQAGRIVHAETKRAGGPIYAASASGNVWRGSWSGTDWTCLNDETRFPGITLLRVVEAAGKPRLLVLHNSPASLHYSDDDGETWKLAEGLDTIARWGSFRRGLLVGSGDTIVALGQEWDYEKWNSVMTIYRSTDAGASFHNISRFAASPNRCDIALSDSGSTIVLMRNDSLFDIARDGGIIFRSIVGGGVDFSDVQQVYLAGFAGVGKAGRRELYVFLTDGSNAHCVASTDGGETWSYRGKTIRPYSPNSVTVSALNGDYLFIGGVECLRSHDGGRTWSKHADWWEYYDRPADRLHADIFGIQSFLFPGGVEIFLMSTDGGIYISYDALNSVENLSMSGLNVSQYYSTYTRRSDGRALYAGSQDQGLQYASIDGGGVLDFEQVISGDYGHLVSSDGGRSLWCNYPGFSMFRQAGVESMPRWSFTGQGQLWLPPIVADPNDPKRAFVTNTGEDGGTYLWHLKATDTSVTATQLPFDFSGKQRGRNISAIAISPIDPDYRYVMTTDGFFFHTSDAGKSWRRTDTSFIGPGGHYFYGASIVPSPKVLGRVYIGGSGYSNVGAFVSNDHGVTFDSITTGLPGTLIYDMDVDPDEQFLFAATEAGPYLYDVGRNQWASMATTASPDQTFWSVEYVEAINTVRFGTHGRGIWDFAIESVASGVASQDTRDAAELSLAVTPNPLRSVAAIAVMMPKSGMAHLRVYDIEGRIVRELHDGQLGAGMNRLTWDGRSSGGYQLPSGRYLVTLNAHGSVRYAAVDIVR